MMSDLEMLQESNSDLIWLRNNMKSIRAKYEGEFIALKNKEIVAFAPNVDVLIRKLKEANVDENSVLVKFISLVNQIIVL